jgi:hypothetical protein
MKVIAIIFFLLVSYRAFAPEFHALCIAPPEKIDPYKAIKYAIGRVEVGNAVTGVLDTLAYNPVEQACGYFQIRPIRLEDYNKRTGSHYSLKDMYDYEKAEKVFMHYAAEIGYRNPCKIARNWNGSGPKTWVYWNKVRKFLII